MLRNIKQLLVITLLLVPQLALSQSGLAGSLGGRILLQVEEHGEAWYVSPSDMRRYYLGRPADALAIMRGQGIGITNYDLSRIPIANMSGLPDADNDGLTDALETALNTDPYSADTDKDGFSDLSEIVDGFNPNGPGRLAIDRAFTGRQLGKIFLQVESRGEAWYVNPKDQKRYFLGRPADALSLMRALGLGITNLDLNEIPAATVPAVDISTAIGEPEEPARIFGELDLSVIERTVHEMVNLERLKLGLPALAWNKELAAVAREHSQDLSEENQGITAFGASCDYPIIHHEGKEFGLYNTERLHNRGVYYIGKSGENIALVSGADIRVQLELDDPEGPIIDNCQTVRSQQDAELRRKLDSAEGEEKISVIEAEIDAREALFKKAKILPVVEFNWNSESEVAVKIAQGWMESPGHRENIAEADFDETGVGVSYINGYVIATQIYIQRANCGYETGPCCIKIGYYPYCYVPLRCNVSVCESE